MWVTLSHQSQTQDTNWSSHCPPSPTWQAATSISRSNTSKLSKQGQKEYPGTGSMCGNAWHRLILEAPLVTRSCVCNCPSEAPDDMCPQLAMLSFWTTFLRSDETLSLWIQEPLLTSVLLWNWYERLLQLSWTVQLALTNSSVAPEFPWISYFHAVDDASTLQTLLTDALAAVSWSCTVFCRSAWNVVHTVHQLTLNSPSWFYNRNRTHANHNWTLRVYRWFS